MIHNEQDQITSNELTGACYLLSSASCVWRWAHGQQWTNGTWQLTGFIGCNTSGLLGAKRHWYWSKSCLGVGHKRTLFNVLLGFTSLTLLGDSCKIVSVFIHCQVMWWKQDLLLGLSETLELLDVINRKHKVINVKTWRVTLCQSRVFK